MKEKLPNCIYTRHFPQFTFYLSHTHIQSHTGVAPGNFGMNFHFASMSKMHTHSHTRTHRLGLHCVYLFVFLFAFLHFSHASIAATKFFLLNSSLHTKHVCMCTYVRVYVCVCHLVAACYQLLPTQLKCI